MVQVGQRLPARPPDQGQEEDRVTAVLGGNRARTLGGG